MKNAIVVIAFILSTSALAQTDDCPVTAGTIASLVKLSGPQLIDRTDIVLTDIYLCAKHKLLAEPVVVDFALSRATADHEDELKRIILEEMDSEKAFEHGSISAQDLKRQKEILAFRKQQEAQNFNLIQTSLLSVKRAE